MANIKTVFCVDGSGNKNRQEADLKRPVYRLDVQTGRITRPLLQGKETTHEFFERQVDSADISEPILIAADLPIGLPTSRQGVYETVKAHGFLQWLEVTNRRMVDSNQQWRTGLIADSVSARTDLKPFVSIGKGDKAADVSEKRMCDVASGGESVYCVDHGGKQVGKAAMQFWFEVLLPLRDKYSSDLGVWPFESIENKPIVVGECYPAECQRVVYSDKISKRNPLKVAGALHSLLEDDGTVRGVSTATLIHAASSEDEFDMFTTAFAYRLWLKDGRDPFWHPEDCEQMEGWMLGLDRTEPLAPKKKSRSKRGGTGSLSVPVNQSNRNAQRNLGPTEETGPKGPLHRMRCEHVAEGVKCGHEYLTNAQDVFQKKCPHCQGGA